MVLGVFKHYCYAQYRFKGYEIMCLTETSLLNLQNSEALSSALCLNFLKIKGKWKNINKILATCFNFFAQLYFDLKILSSHL